MIITFLIDNPSSWMMKYIPSLKLTLQKTHNVKVLHDASEIIEGDIAFFLSCEKMIQSDIRKKK